MLRGIANDRHATIIQLAAHLAGEKREEAREITAAQAAEERNEEYGRLERNEEYGRLWERRLEQVADMDRQQERPRGAEDAVEQTSAELRVCAAYPAHTFI